MAFENLTILIGKTFSGKTTFVKNHPEFDSVTSHTTRPMRLSEIGTEYVFEDADSAKNQRKIAERTYDTVDGPWSYWMTLESLETVPNPLVILDLEGSIGLLEELYLEYGPKIMDKIQILYLQVDTDILLKRMYYSSRGKTEDIQESVRRLISDNEANDQLEMILRYDRTSGIDGTLDVTKIVMKMWKDNNGKKEKNW